MLYLMFVIAVLIGMDETCMRHTVKYNGYSSVLHRFYMVYKHECHYGVEKCTLGFSFYCVFDS